MKIRYLLILLPLVGCGEAKEDNSRNVNVPKFTTEVMSAKAFKAGTRIGFGMAVMVVTREGDLITDFGFKLTRIGSETTYELNAVESRREMSARHCSQGLCFQVIRVNVSGEPADASLYQLDIPFFRFKGKDGEITIPTEKWMGLRTKGVRIESI